MNQKININNKNKTANPSNMKILNGEPGIYGGSKYYGCTKQKHEISIQDHLEKALSKIFKEKTIIHCSGRTDKEVHALHQYFHFHSEMIFDPHKLVSILNSFIN